MSAASTTSAPRDPRTQGLSSLVSGGRCRVCLGAAVHRHYQPMSIFDGPRPLYRRIVRAAHVHVSPDDGFPHLICRSCLTLLKAAHRFVVRCQNSDALLRQQQIREKRPQTPQFCATDLVETLINEDFVAGSPGADSPGRSKTKTRGVSCEVCGLSISSRSAMVIHMRKHTGERPYKCDHCDGSFAQKGTLAAHIAHRHEKLKRKRKHTCEMCGKQFPSTKDVEVHKRCHTGETPYACDYCPKRFTQVSSLIRHKRIHTGEKPYVCTECGKSFSDSCRLTSHKSVHSDEKKFTCNICTKKFKSKSSLKVHLDLHKNCKDNVCDQCGRGFAAKGNLVLHVKNVHSEKSGICPICKRHTSNLDHHIPQHTKNLQFSCHICDKRFALKRSLSKHIFAHNNANKFKCDVGNYCNKTFSQKYALNYHIMKWHSDEKQQKEETHIS